MPLSAGGAHLVVFANEKGGTGKSTLSIQVAIAAANLGYRVSAFDLDHRQKTFGRMMENRASSCERLAVKLASVKTHIYDPDTDRDIIEALDRVGTGADLVIVDTPGRHDMTSLVTMGRAETLVTPLNDSLVDFDLIGQVDPADHALKRPSFYTRLIWDIRRERMSRGAPELDWIVLRNRLHNLASRNTSRVSSALDRLSGRAGFRVVPGLTERVCYRELFPEGLSPLDIKLTSKSSGSIANAQAELRSVFQSLNLPKPKALAVHAPVTMQPETVQDLHGQAMSHQHAGHTALPH